MDGDDPFETTLKVIGGKHKIGVLWILSSHDSMRFSDLRRVLRISSPRMLSISLRELEEDGMISRKVISESPPWVEYRLTPTGMSIIPYLEDLATWGAAYQDMMRARGRRGSLY